MVFQKISKDVKDCAIELHYQGLAPEDICISELQSYSSEKRGKKGKRRNEYLFFELGLFDVQ